MGPRLQNSDFAIIIFKCDDEGVDEGDDEGVDEGVDEGGNDGDEGGNEVTEGH